MSSVASFPRRKSTSGNIHCIKTVSSVDYLEPNGNNPIVKLFEKYSAYHIFHDEKSFTTTELLSWCIEAQWQQVSHVYIGFVPTFFPEWPARVVHFVQPLFEKVPFFNTYLSAQIVIVCSNTAE